MLIVQNLSYLHPGKDELFNNISFNIAKHQKVALTGTNGAGKSTLLKIMAGLLLPTSGLIHTTSKPYYVPQLFGQFNDHTVAEALGVAGKLNALQQILEGNVNGDNLATLDDDWNIEEKCKEALACWGLTHLSLTEKLSSLSGGQATKVFLAGIFVHQPEVILLDEPTNHLDMEGRELVYDLMRSGRQTMVVVSHDRQLLNIPDTLYELDNRGITIYGGNYEFYEEQKRIAQHALQQELKAKEKEWRKAKETQRETAERRQKLDARGKKKQEKAGLPTISMNTFKNNAEKSTSRLKEVHTEKLEEILQSLQELRKEVPSTDTMKLNFDTSGLHKGRILVTLKDVNFGHRQQFFWKEPLSIEIRSGERIALKGRNGSGKTSLIKLLLGENEPGCGTVQKNYNKTVYIDQDYSLLNPQLSVYGQMQKFNDSALQEHELKTRLNRFLFTKNDWDKLCGVLSGGERMRLLLCCLQASSILPDMIVLDEPTNNLDLQNIAILTAALSGFAGTLIVVSHDEHFLKEIKAERVIWLK